MVLHTLADNSWRAGRLNGGLKDIEEAVRIRRALVDANPEMQPDLDRSLELQKVLQAKGASEAVPATAP